MAKRSLIVPVALFGAVLVGLALRAVTAHSVGPQPLIYRVTTNVNDLDGVEGLAPPGRFVELWMRQRTFKEGEDGTADPFSWCTWKNHGNMVQVAAVQADAAGIWRLQNLRAAGNTVMVFPPGPGEDACRGGLYTELLPRACDAPNVGCTDFATPQLHWMNVKKLTQTVGVVMGSVSGAEQTAAAVADGPDDGPEPSDVVDVDQNGIDTTAPGFKVGQRVTWRCGQGGTAPCPSVTVHDASTAIQSDPEFPFLLGTIQGHRAGGSFIAAAAIPRGTPIGFSVNVNVKFRGRLDVNLGCDNQKFFDFSVPFVY